MIRKSIADTANTFAAEIGEKFPHTKLATLDFSWPSVGVLDRLLFWLRGKPQLTETDSKLVHCVASYIGCMAHDVWQESYGGKVVVDQGRRGVELRLSDSPYLKNDETLLLPIEAEILRLLKISTGEIPVIASFSRLVPFDYNFLSLFVFGVLLGPSPVVDGSWAEMSLEQFEKPIKIGVAKLLKSSHRYYTQCYPDDQLGQNLLSNIEQFVYPPTLMEESFPVENLTKQILEYWKDGGYSLKQLQETAANFATLLDEKISLVGLAISFAISDKVEPRIFAQSERYGANISILSKAIDDARRFLGFGDSWIIKDQLDENDELRIRFEKKVGLHPFLQLSPSWIVKNFKDQKIRRVVEFLFSTSVKEAFEQIRLIVEDKPRLIDLRLQALFFEYLDIANQQPIKKLREILTEPDGDQSAQLYLLWGLCEARIGNHAEAAKRFKAAFELSNPEDEVNFDAPINYIKATSFLGDLQGAQEMIDKLEAIPFRPVDLLLVKTAVFRAASRAEEAENCLQELIKIAPLDVSLVRETLYSNKSYKN